MAISGNRGTYLIIKFHFIIVKRVFTKNYKDNLAHAYDKMAIFE